MEKECCPLHSDIKLDKSGIKYLDCESKLDVAYQSPDARKSFPLRQKQYQCLVVQVSFQTFPVHGPPISNKVHFASTDFVIRKIYINLAKGCTLYS